MLLSQAKAKADASLTAKAKADASLSQLKAKADASLLSFIAKTYIPMHLTLFSHNT